MRRGGFLFAAFLFVVLGSSFGAHALTTTAADGSQSPLVISLEDGLRVVVQPPDLLGTTRRVEVVAASQDELLRVSASQLQQQSSDPGEPSSPNVSPTTQPRTAPPRVVQDSPPDVGDVTPPFLRVADDVVVPRLLDFSIEELDTRDGIVDVANPAPAAYAALLVATMVSALMLWVVNGRPLAVVRR